MENADNNKSPSLTNPQSQSAPENLSFHRLTLGWSARLALVLVLAILASHAIGLLLSDWTHLFPAWQVAMIEAVLDLALALLLLYFFAVRSLIRESTQRQRAEAELCASEEQFLSAFEYAAIGMALLDPGGHWLKVNRALCALIGYSEKELLAKTFQDITHPDDLETDLGYVRQMLSGEIRTFQMEKRYFHKAGQIVWIQLNVSLVHDSQGKPLHFISQIQDITERKRAIAELRESEERFRLLLDGVYDYAIFMLDTEGRVTSWNAGAQRLKGYQAGETIGQHFSRFYLPEDAVAGKPARELAEAAARGRMEDENWRVRKDGSRFWANVIITAIRDAKGDLRGFAEITRDLTERKRAELRIEHLMRLYAMLSQVNQAIVRTKERDELFRTICRVAVDFGKFGLAWIGWIDRETGDVTPCAVHGAAQDRLPFQTINHRESPFKDGLMGKAVRSGNVVYSQDIQTDPAMQHWREVAVAGNYHAAAAAPFRLNGEITGILVLFATEVDFFADEEQDKLLAETALDISFALDGMEKAREREEAEQQIQLQSAALEAAANAIIITDLKGDILWVNAAFTTFTGYAPEEVIGKNSRMLKSGKQDEHFYRDLWQTIRSGQVWQGEIVNRRKNGSLYMEEMTITPVCNHGGEIARFIAIKQDITERKRAEEALKLFRALVDRAGDAIEVLDPETGRFLDVNARGCLDLGYCREEFLSLSVFDIDPMVNQSVFTKFVEKLRKSGALKWEGSHRRKDGSTFPVEVNLEHVRFDRDYLLAVVRDITERKGAEQERQRLITLVENSLDFIGLAELDGKVSYLNAAGRRMVGLRTEEEMKGKTVFDFFAEDDLQRLRTEVMPARMQTGRWQGEIRFRDFQTGRMVPVEMDAFVISDPKTRQPVMLASVCRDLTEKKALERQFLRTQRLESLGNLASGIAHDLNNILAPILMSAQLLEFNKPDEETSNILATIIGSAKRGADIVKQVLTFARGVEGERVAVQPKYLVKEMEKIFRETFPKSITFRFEAPRGLWSVTGDATQLHQVLMNLCVNARDAMPNGGTLVLSAENVQVRKAMTDLFAHAKPGPHLLIRVTDTGEGIPPAIMERIFEPFFTTKEQGKGTGLGLSTVLGIVRSHGGFVDVESEPGRGSTFKIYLPAQPSEETEHLRRVSAASPAGAGEWVLVVDDEANIRHMTRAILDKHGYEVLLAANGKEALDLLSARADQVKVVITDIMMPVMEGVALIRTMKQSYPQIPVIACTGWGQEGLQAQLKELGVKAFLEKPYETAKLLAAVHEYLTADQ